MDFYTFFFQVNRSKWFSKGQSPLKAFGLFLFVYFYVFPVGEGRGASAEEVGRGVVKYGLERSWDLVAKYMLPLNITVSCEPVCPGGVGDRAWQRGGGERRIEEVGNNSFFPILRCKLLLNTSEFSVATEKVHKPFSSNLVIFITFLSASPNHCCGSQFQYGGITERLKAENSGTETGVWSRIQEL